MTHRHGSTSAGCGRVLGLLVLVASGGCIDYFAEPPALPPLSSTDGGDRDATASVADATRPGDDPVDAAADPADAALADDLGTRLDAAPDLDGADLALDGSTRDASDVSAVDASALDVSAVDSVAADQALLDLAAPDAEAVDLGPGRDATLDSDLRDLDPDLDAPDLDVLDLAPDLAPDLDVPDACPARAEQCDGIDDDCDGAIDEGYSLGEPCRRGIGQCEAEGAWVCGDDGRARCDAVPTPGSDERCNLADDDCDGIIDEEIAVVGTACRTPATGRCAAGRLACEAGTLQCTVDLQPRDEQCDGGDDDCDGRVDEGVRSETGDCLPEGVTRCLPSDGPCPPPEEVLPISEAEVLTVPHSPRLPGLPHLAHPGAPVTLKAIVRGAGECALWLVQWDSDLDGRFDDEPVLERRPILGTLYDIGQPWVAPTVHGGGLVRVGVRVRDTCAGRAAVGEMPIYITPSAPPDEPWRWTAEAIDLMNVMAGAEARWYLHRQLGGRRGTGRDATGLIDPADDEATAVLASALTTWILAVDGRRPGLPPWTGPGPDPLDGIVPGGPADRIDEWARDPYAETTLRLVNHLASRATEERVVPPLDEGTACGYFADGQVRLCNRPPGTSDTSGLWIPTESRLEISAHAMATVALSITLFAQIGYPVPVEGPAHMQRWEWLVQQLVDALGAAQIDEGCAEGGWMPEQGGVGSVACPTFDWWSTHDGLLALGAAEIAGAVAGVTVTNRHRYRPVDLIMSALDPATGAALGLDGSDYRHTATALLYLRDIGANGFPRRPEPAFPNESDQTYASLSDAYRDVLSWSGDQWEDDARRRADGGLDRLWATGDRLCGDLNGIYNGERCGSLYNLFAYAVAYYSGVPLIEEIHDASAERDHDWIREFSTYVLRAQDRDVADYGSFGRVIDECDDQMWPCAWSNGPISTAWAVIALGLPFVALPAVPRLTLDPPLVTLSGCGPEDHAEVRADWSASFHPSDSKRIIAVAIDRDASDGLWWIDGSDPDFAAEVPAEATTLTYTAPGRYRLTLRTVASDLDLQTTSAQLTVLSPPNRAPTIDAGGPYEIDFGAPLRPTAEADDPDLACGDHLDIAWDIDGDGVFADGEGSRPEIPPWRLRALPRGVLTTIAVRATDSQGGVSVDEAALIIR